MKSSLVLASALAAGLAAAVPLEKRLLVTQMEIFTSYVTVTGAAPQSTDTSGSRTGFDWAAFFSNLHRGGSGNNVQQAPAAAPTSTYVPPASSAPAASQQVPASSAAAAAAPANTVAISSDYSQGILDAHNNHRANHSVPALVWSDRMAQYAQQIAASCVYEHQTQIGAKDFGQNIGAGVQGNGVPGMITNMMYNGEINHYPGYGGEPSMNDFHEWGHFSQIVWKNTQEVGCYTQHCPNGLANTGGNVPPYFTVCNYHPPGNYGGQYGANVLKPGNMPTITL